MPNEDKLNVFTTGKLPTETQRESALLSKNALTHSEADVIRISVSDDSDNDNDDGNALLFPNPPAVTDAIMDVVDVSVMVESNVPTKSKTTKNQRKKDSKKKRMALEQVSTLYCCF